VKAQIRVDLPRPRSGGDPAFVALRERIPRPHPRRVRDRDMNSAGRVAFCHGRRRHACGIADLYEAEGAFVYRGDIAGTNLAST
jgi:hypothetical protein